MIRSFVLSAGGRPRGLSRVLAVLWPKSCGNTSLAGRARAKVLAVHSGLSASSSSGLGRLFILFYPSRIGFTQADHVNFALARGEYHGMKPVADEAQHLKALFAIIFAIILHNQGARLIQFVYQREGQLPRLDIGFVFCRVEADRHAIYCTHNKCFVNYGAKKSFNAINTPSGASVIRE